MEKSRLRLVSKPANVLCCSVVVRGLLLLAVVIDAKIADLFQQLIVLVVLTRL